MTALLTPGRDVPPLYRDIAQAAPRSRAAAVKLFCLECVGFVRADVTTCTATRCPLFAWRPYQSASPREIPGLTALETAQAGGVASDLAQAGARGNG